MSVQFIFFLANQFRISFSLNICAWKSLLYIFMIIVVFVYFVKNTVVIQINM